MMPHLSVACVMLQRVPPDIRIFTPGPAILFQEQRPPAALGGFGSGRRAGERPHR